MEGVLLIWRYTFEETRRRGLAAFGERYLLVRHEDFCRDPVGELEAIYSMVRRDLPDEVRDWCRTFVKVPSDPFEALNPSWASAFARLEMAQALGEAGYGSLLDARPRHSAASPSG